MIAPIRLLKHYCDKRRGGVFAIRHIFLSLVLTAVTIAGGVLIYVGTRDSPEAQIDRLTIRDHQRALRLAKHPTPSTSSAIRVAWDPTLPNEVATISIPALGVSAPVLAEVPVDGALIIPADVRNVGWDDQTPTPGLSGVTLLAGHVNWVGQGEGALGAIGQLVSGDRVILDWRGQTSTWQINTKPVLSPNSEVHPWLFSNQGPPRLALVTCGGPFREIPGVGGSYADNVIVQAVPVSASVR